MSPIHQEAGFLQWHRQIQKQTTDTHCKLETELADWADFKLKQFLFDFRIPAKESVYKSCQAEVFETCLENGL